MQRRLEALLEEAKEKRETARQRKYAVRYHKIRFFERVKIERLIKKLEKEIKNCTVDSTRDNLERQLIQAREDLEYVLHFPKGEKYVSLLKDANDEEAQKVLQAERKRLRALVKKQMADEAIVTELNEGRVEQHTVMKPVESGVDAEELEDDEAKRIEADDFFLQDITSEESMDNDVAGQGQSEQSEDDKHQLVSDKVQEASEDYDDDDILSRGGSSSYEGEDDVAVSDENCKHEVKARLQRRLPKKGGFHRAIPVVKQHSSNGELTTAVSKTVHLNMKKQIQPPKPVKTRQLRGNNSKKAPLRTRAEGGRKRRRKSK